MEVESVGNEIQKLPLHGRWFGRSENSVSDLARQRIRFVVYVCRWRLCGGVSVVVTTYTESLSLAM